MAEWSIAPVLKTGKGQPFVSSNLTASAKSTKRPTQGPFCFQLERRYNALNQKSNQARKVMADSSLVNEAVCEFGKHRNILIASSIHGSTCPVWGSWVRGPLAHDVADFVRNCMQRHNFIDTAEFHRFFRHAIDDTVFFVLGDGAGAGFVHFQ